jgi:hypothetical protein
LLCIGKSSKGREKKKQKVVERDAGIYDDEEHAIDNCPYTPCYIVPYTYLIIGGGEETVLYVPKMLPRDL